jgi:hypothetical protein
MEEVGNDACACCGEPGVLDFVFEDVLSVFLSDLVGGTISVVPKDGHGADEDDSFWDEDGWRLGVSFRFLPEVLVDFVVKKVFLDILRNHWEVVK